MFIGVNNAGISIGDSLTSEFLSITPTGSIYTSAISGKGIEYFADYSATYSNRSLVDKAYADTKLTLPALTTGSVLFSNGTTIAQDNANFFWNDTDNRLGIGTTSPDRLLHVEISDTVTNAVTYAQILSHITSGTATTSFGIGIEYELENASGTNRVAATQEFTWSDATNVTEDTTYALKLMRNGTLSNPFTVYSTGQIDLGTNPVSLYTTNTNTLLTPTINARGFVVLTALASLADANAMTIKDGGNSATSGTTATLGLQSSFAAGAGSAAFRPLSIAYTINNSGAQSGTATGLYLRGTETALNSMIHNLLDLGTATSMLRVDNVGNLFLGAATVGTSGTNVFATKIGTSPSTSPADTIQIFAKDSSAGSANATIAIRTEQAVEAGVAIASTDKLRVWVNGIEYYIGLTAV